MSERYINIENWHNPTIWLRIIRVINKIVLGVLVFIAVTWLKEEKITGGDALLSLIAMVPFLVLVSFGLNSTNKEIETTSTNKTNNNIAVSESVYKDYIEHFKVKVVWTFALLSLCLYVFILGISSVEDAANSLMEIDMFFEIFNEKCQMYVLFIFGSILTIINMIYSNSLHFRLTKKMRRYI